MKLIVHRFSDKNKTSPFINKSQSSLASVGSIINVIKKINVKYYKINR